MGLHFQIDVLTVASCVSVVGALIWYLLRMRGRRSGFAGATTLLCVFALALAVTRIVQFVLPLWPEAAGLAYLDAFGAALTVLTAVAIWPLIPKLVAMPTRCELVEANHRLVEEQAARLALVEQMRGLNEDLEARVAERTRELEVARRRFEIALEGTTIAVAQQDRDLRYTWVYNLPPVMGDADPIGRRAEETMPPTTAQVQNELKRRVIASGVAERFEVAMPTPSGEIWFEGRVEPLIEAGEIVGTTTVSIDITRHKAHEREIRDMLRELTHRSKNLLAVVQGIARQSAAGRPEVVETFLGPFNGRLQALSHAHEILVEETWTRVPLRLLIERECLAAGKGSAPAFVIEGDDSRLSPETAQHFVLGLHELTKDATAAFPIARGPTIRWSTRGECFTFEWVRPGPPTDLLAGGFGRVFLTRHLPRAVDGTATLSVAPDATTYRLEAPAIRL